MAKAGDTITYSYDGDLDSNDDIKPEQEDVTNIDEATVDYCDGEGGSDSDGPGSSGGRVEDATIDLTGQDTLYIFVSGSGNGRYSNNSIGIGGPPAGSTEVTFSNTNQTDSADEPFLIGAGGGGSGFGSGTFDSGSNGGARGGSGVGGGLDGEGIAPPAGGDGAPDTSTAAEAGDGAIDDQNRGLVTGGTTIKGGGSDPDTTGEVQISYASTLSPPDPPSNLSAEVQ